MATRRDNEMVLDQRSIRQIIDGLNKAVGRSDRLASAPGRSTSASSGALPPQFAEDFKKLDKVVQSVQKSMKQAADAGRMSAGEIERGSRRMADAMRDVEKIQDKLSSSTAITAKEQQKLTRRMQEAQKAIQREGALHRDMNRRELSMRERLMRQMALEAKGAGKRAVEAGKRAGSAAAGRAADASQRIVQNNSRIGNYNGGLDVSGINQAVDYAQTALSLLGPAGVAVAVGLEAAQLAGAAQIAAYNKQLEGSSAISKRWLTYGSSVNKNIWDTSSGFKAAWHEGLLYTKMFQSAAEAGLKWDLVTDEIKSAQLKIADTTGASVVNISAVTDRLARLGKHLGSVDQAAEQTTTRMRAYGQSLEQALDEQEAMIEGVNALNDMTPDPKQKTVLDEYVRAVTEVRQGVDSIAMGTKNLSKLMITTLKISKDLRQTTEQQQKGMKDIGSAVYQGRDLGFRTMFARENLQAVLKPGSGATEQQTKDAQRIQGWLQEGKITEVEAARFMRQAGLEDAAPVMAQAVERIFTSPFQAMREAEFGELGYEATSILEEGRKEFDAARARGESGVNIIERVQEQLSKMKADKSELQLGLREQGMNQAQLDPARLAEVAVSKGLVLMAEKTQFATTNLQELAVSAGQLAEFLDGDYKRTLSPRQLNEIDRMIKSSTSTVSSASAEKTKSVITTKEIQKTADAAGAALEKSSLFGPGLQHGASATGTPGSATTAGTPVAAGQPTVTPNSSRVTPGGDVVLNIVIPASSIQGVSSIEDQRKAGTSNQ